MTFRIFLLPVVLVWFSACSKAPIINIELNADGIERVNYPLTIPLDPNLALSGDYILENETSGKTYQAQALPSGELMVFIDQMPSETEAVFGLSKSSGNKEYKMKINQTEEGVEVISGQQPVLFYQTAVAKPPSGLPDYYKRSGMIHPLYSPSGQALTDAFPAGHTHHHAIFNAWVNTKFKGEKVDFWNQHSETGTAEHVNLISAAAGPSAAIIESTLRHLSLKEGEVLGEKWTIMVYPTDDYFLFDLISEQTNTSTDTLFILEYHYGGMGFRGSKEWNNVDSTNFTNTWEILTSEGYTNENANHTHASWVTASGEVDSKTAGVTVFGFPDNFRYPQAIRVHPSMPYWVYAPMVDGEFYIAPGDSYKSKFRYYVPNGKPNQEVIENIDEGLKSPIKVKVMK
ncbi:PmoA family protein [uncultured Cyclobacterium sp.]|uniref:DUF6807 domain-containing protein n=1 Tax=uncultured Cyclobacterium sp. TaxID=453820 RepID=UPI0030EB2A7E